MSGPYWWEDRNEIAALIRYLDETGCCGDWNLKDVAYLVEKPWKWDDEYAEMVKARAAERESEVSK